MKDPWQRDHEDYSVLNTLLLVMCAVLICVGAWALKVQHKQTITEAMRYGCSIAQADPLTGECK